MRRRRNGRSMLAVGNTGSQRRPDRGRRVGTALAFGCVAAFGAVASSSAGTAHAAAPTFHITQVFSNRDGSMQFVELTEYAGQNDQHRLAGLTLTSRHDGVVKTFVFPNDLPSSLTAHRSIVVAATQNHVLPTTNFPFECCSFPAYDALPARFLSTRGGTVEFAGVDAVTYSALPTSGVAAIDRAGNPVVATVPDCESLPCRRLPLAHVITLAVEYRHAENDRYVMTVDAPEIEALDDGRIAGWTRTGTAFIVGASADAYPGLAQPVCRFFVPAEDAHFLSASPDECAQVAMRHPGFVRETGEAFYVKLPDPSTGTCLPPEADSDDLALIYRFRAVYRLWRPGSAEHRYTADGTEFYRLLASGYVHEGIAMCTK